MFRNGKTEWYNCCMSKGKYQYSTKEDLVRRNVYATFATFRRAGSFRHKCEPRDGATNLQREFMEQCDDTEELVEVTDQPLSTDDVDNNDLTQPTTSGST